MGTVHGGFEASAFGGNTGGFCGSVIINNRPVNAIGNRSVSIEAV